jgi:hypothetical protein
MQPLQELSRRPFQSFFPHFVAAFVIEKKIFAARSCIYLCLMELLVEP